MCLCIVHTWTHYVHPNLNTIKIIKIYNRIILWLDVNVAILFGSLSMYARTLCLCVYHTFFSLFSASVMCVWLVPVRALLSKLIFADIVVVIINIKNAKPSFVWSKRRQFTCVIFYCTDRTKPNQRPIWLWKQTCSAAFAVLNFLWHQQPQKNNINWHFMFFASFPLWNVCASALWVLGLLDWAHKNFLSRLHWQWVGCRSLAHSSLLFRIKWKWDVTMTR